MVFPRSSSIPANLFMLGIEKTIHQDRYRLIQHFEQDEQSNTYKAFDNVLQTDVLLKEIPINFQSVNYSQAKDLQNFFISEARILSSIQHASLPHIHDFFSETDRGYLVMEMIDGKSLQDIYQEIKAPFEFVKASQYADQILDALGYLHKNQPPIVHSAVNPQNIKLTGAGKIKLLNAGYANLKADNNNYSNQTSGTADLPYLPLEQLWNGLDSASRKVVLNSYDERSEKILEQPLDARTDIYALGATLYYLLTAQHPADALTRSIDILEGKNDPLKSPSEIDSNIPASISNVVLRSMEIRRENRFDSAVIMRQILRSAIAQAKQNEAEKAKQQAEAQVELKKIAEQERFEQERRDFEAKRKEIEAEKARLEEEKRLVEQKKKEVEAENQRKAELLARQLREAESQKLLAEQRAAEAERLLRESQNKFIEQEEIFELDDIQILEDEIEKPAFIAEAKIEENSAQFQNGIDSTSAIENSPIFEDAIVIEEKIEPDKTPVAEVGDLFAQPPAQSGRFRMIAIFAVVLLAIGGAAAWFFVNSNKQPANSSVSEQTVPVNNSSAVNSEQPVVEPNAPTESTAQTVSESNSNVVSTNSAEENPATETVEPTENSDISIRRNSPAPSVERPKKIAVSPTTPEPKPKKSVTVDDIISDN